MECWVGHAGWPTVEGSPIEISVRSCYVYCQNTGSKLSRSEGYKVGVWASINSMKLTLNFSVVWARVQLQVFEFSHLDTGVVTGKRPSLPRSSLLRYWDFVEFADCAYSKWRDSLAISLVCTCLCTALSLSMFEFLILPSIRSLMSALVSDREQGNDHILHCHFRVWQHRLADRKSIRPVKSRTPTSNSQGS